MSPLHSQPSKVSLCLQSKIQTLYSDLQNHAQHFSIKLLTCVTCSRSEMVLNIKQGTSALIIKTMLHFSRVAGRGNARDEDLTN